MKEYYQFDMRVVYARHLTMILKAPASLLLAFSARYQKKEDNWKYGAQMIAFDCMLRNLPPGQDIPDSFFDGTPEDPIHPGDPRYIRDYLPYILHPLQYTNTRTYIRTITHLQSNNFTHDEIIKELAPSVRIPSTDFWGRGTCDVEEIERLLKAILQGRNVTEKMLLYQGRILPLATVLQTVHAEAAALRGGIVTRSHTQFPNSRNRKLLFILSHFCMSLI